ncbi:MAG: M23/M56 family metallopeptidase [Pseudomonadota bacterium]
MSLPLFVLMSLLWTGLVAAGAEALSRRNISVYAGFAVWRSAAVLMALPWLAAGLAAFVPDARLPLPVDVPWPDLVSTDGGAAGVDTRSQPAHAPRTFGIGQIVMFSLCIGWTARLIFAGFAHYRLHCLIQGARPAPAHIERVVRSAASQTGLAHVTAVFEIDTPVSPFVAGIFQPKLYIPTRLRNEAALPLMLLHECCHIARGDMLMRPIERSIADLLWFSPFAWIARARLDYFREAACDAAAVARTGNPIAYARALGQTARLCQVTRELPVTALFLNPKRSLPMRITALISPVPEAPSRRRVVIGAALAALAAPFALAQGFSGGPAAATADFSGAIITHPDARITSGYGERIHPFTRAPAFHRGVDIGAPFGTDVLAPAAGRVLMTGSKGNYGTIVELELEGSGHRLRFAQLQSYSVNVGDRVEAGDKIGEVGASGMATGPHLHIEYITDDGDIYVDPRSVGGLILIGD